MIFTDKLNKVVLVKLNSRHRNSLWRVHKDTKLGPILGYVYSMTDDFYPIKIGWQRFPIKIWIYTAHWGIGVGQTRKEVIHKLVNRYIPVKIKVAESCKLDGCHMIEQTAMLGTGQES